MSLDFQDRKSLAAHSCMKDQRPFGAILIIGTWFAEFYFE